jgi:GAF domain-containing protein
VTEAEVLSHPLYRGFAPFADSHPPMRGWLATSVCGDDGRSYGMLQLSDKSGGRDFDESDEANIRELAALIGETLDAFRLAAQRSA